jgi:hypothetical protein
MSIRSRLSIIAVLAATALAALFGCSNQDPTLLSPKTPGVFFSETVAPIQLVFISRTYDGESNQTTFLYQLQNTPDYGPASETPVVGLFTDVMVELPSCAGEPVSYAPPDGATIYTNPNGIYGIEWGVGYDENPDFYYSVAFDGDIPAGVVRGMVETGGFVYIQNITGPCEGTFQVAGTVFIDTNSNSLLDEDEFGIPDVTVKLSDGESDQTFKTDSDGHYLFIATEGTYTVTVDAVTADSDFNETLFAAWDPTTPTSREVTVGPDSFGNDFGFTPNIENILTGIEEGDYPTDGKSYKWWRKEFLRVIRGNDNTTYTEAELLDFVHQIEALALLDEYDFTPGQELQQVYDILNNHAFGDDDGESIMLGTKGVDQGRHDEVAFLLRELLTTELNHVSGRGLSDEQLQALLVNWGEGVLDFNTQPVALGVVVGDVTPQINYSPLEAGTLFKGINGATGGGGTDD